MVEGVTLLYATRLAPALPFLRVELLEKWRTVGVQVKSSSKLSKVLVRALGGRRLCWVLRMCMVGAGSVGQSEAVDRLQAGMGCVIKQLSRC